MSNAEGRWSGSEKAQRHMELCQFYVAAFKFHGDPDTVRREFPKAYEAVHYKTQELTGFLDEKIGFPLTGRPDYEKLEPLFFEQFHELAMIALRTPEQ
jgi:hypothetical protein